MFDEWRKEEGDNMWKYLKLQLVLLLDRCHDTPEYSRRSALLKWGSLVSLLSIFSPLNLKQIISSVCPKNGEDEISTDKVDLSPSDSYSPVPPDPDGHNSCTCRQVRCSRAPDGCLLVRTKLQHLVIRLRQMKRYHFIIDTDLKVETWVLILKTSFIFQIIEVEYAF